MKPELPTSTISRTSIRTPKVQICSWILTLFVLGAAVAVSAQARTLTVLHTFTGGPDGANPQGELIRDSAGNLYGTTRNGGDTSSESFGCGTVFKIDSNGNETTLLKFGGGKFGCVPLGGVIRDAAGNLYGTTTAGGEDGWGTIYKLDKDGIQTRLYSFTGAADGGNPVGSLVRDAAGNLYGTTASGGINNCIQGGFSPTCGTVFKLDTSGTETALYTFQGTTDGSIPFSGLTLDDNGNLYGTTWNGGHEDANSVCDVFGCGTVFKIDASGSFRVLYTFLGKNDGNEPEAPVILDASGNLYGTTYRGQSSTLCGFGCGVIFKVNGAGKETVLYGFAGGMKAASPRTAKLLRGVGGVIWGTTPAGGAFNNGVVYRVDPGGKETDLHNFTGGADGGVPVSGVIRDAAGNFYGSTYNGGNASCTLGGGLGCGTIYKIAAVAP